MQDVKNAYEVLGLKEGASKDDILRRYEMLLKRYNSMKNDSTDREQAESDFNTITHAYNLIMGYEDQGDPVESSGKPNPFYSKLGLDEKKVQNFFYYHKVHIIVALIVILLAGMTVKQVMEKGTVDLNIVFMGELYCEDTIKLQKQIIQDEPEIKGPLVDLIPISGRLDNDMAAAMQNKSSIAVMPGINDVFIMDKTIYTAYAEKGLFVDLEQLAAQLGIDMEKNKDYIIKAETAEGKHLYGIDVGSSGLLKASNVAGNEKIAAIRVDAKHYESAVKFIKLLLKK